MRITIPGTIYLMLAAVRSPDDGGFWFGSDGSVTAFGETSRLTIHDAHKQPHDVVVTELPATLPYLNSNDAQFTFGSAGRVTIRVGAITRDALHTQTTPMNSSRRSELWVRYPPRHTAKLDWRAIREIDKYVTQSGQDFALASANNPHELLHGWLWAGTVHGYNVQFVAYNQGTP